MNAEIIGLLQRFVDECSVPSTTFGHLVAALKKDESEEWPELPREFEDLVVATASLLRAQSNVLRALAGQAVVEL